MPKTYKADEIFRALREHDKRFQIFSHRGKGSHRMIYHPQIDGSQRSFPIPYHKGRDVQRGYLKAIIKRFNLPEDFFG